MFGVNKTAMNSRLQAELEWLRRLDRTLGSSPTMPVRAQVCGSKRLSCHAGHQKVTPQVNLRPCSHVAFAFASMLMTTSTLTLCLW